VRSVGTVVDITHIRETEAALQESERRLRLALDAAQMGIFEADPKADVAHVDRQEAQLLGLPEGTRRVTIQQLRKRVPLEDLRANNAKRARKAEHTEAYHHEFRLSMPDGSERWLSAHADVRADRIFGVHYDITERKLAELALELSEARLRIATNAAALGIFEWDPEADRSTWANDRMYEIFGRTRAEGPLSKQQLIAEYLVPADARDFDTALNDALRTNGRLHTVCRITQKGGGRRWLQIDGRFEHPSASTSVRLVGVVADITERKRLESRAARLSQQLLTIQEEERRSIAQELHDSTVQHLVAANLILISLKRHPSENQQRALDNLEASLEEATRELRAFSYLMHPPAVRGAELYRSLKHYIDGFAERTELACKLRMDRRTEKYPARLRRAVFRIVQEGLANAYRHASATLVVVALRRIGTRLHVVVTDNGRGIDAKMRRVAHRPARPGVGIRGIRTRLSQLGGRLSIKRPPTGGTMLHATLPIRGAPRHTTGSLAPS
jgi:PAS domain S-box-containing protein